MKIPKTIHYCWFGGSQMSRQANRCVASWVKFAPDFRVKLWNDYNYNIHSAPKCIKEAYRRGKYAIVSDFARLDIINKYGGIYFDCDVELIKSIPSWLLDGDISFFSIEKHSKQIATGLGFGSIAHSPILEELVSMYRNTSNILDGSVCGERDLPIFVKRGFNECDEEQKLTDGTRILSSEYMCPKNFDTKAIDMTDKTFSIHQYEGVWCR